MSESDLQAQIDAAKAYEEFFVPALFGQWAPQVADAAQIQTGHHVLDVACGTGVLAREAALRVGTEGFVAGLDASPAMLAVATTLAPTIEWRQAPAEAIPYPEHRFDSAPAYAAEVALLERLAGKTAADALRAPFVLGDPKELAQLVASAGVEGVTLRTHVGEARFPSIRFMVEADLRGWLPLMGVTLTEAQIQHTLQEAEHALDAYVSAAGTTTCRIAAHLVTGVKS